MSGHNLLLVACHLWLSRMQVSGKDYRTKEHGIVRVQVIEKKGLLVIPYEFEPVFKLKCDFKTTFRFH